MDQTIQLHLPELLRFLPKRQPNAHKGQFGHVLVIGGDYGYPGAPVLAALGALRVGAGLVTLASHKETLVGINATHPEIMCQAIDDLDNLKALINKATVIVLGPGLGRTIWSQDVYNAIQTTTLPLVLDADGLYFLAQSPNQNVKRVITPHPGEAATLLHQEHVIEPDQRTTAIKQLILKYSGTVVLKGMGTLVGSTDKNIGVCTAGNPGMASGGMGDLLAGMIGGLIAQGLELDLAAKLGVCVHAQAGDLAAKDGQRGMIATDLLPHIQHIIK